MPRPAALAIVVSLLLIAGCSVRPAGPPLVSAHSPAGTGLVGAGEPQPINSLPPGAEGLAARSPFATAPDYLSYTFGR